MIWTSLRGQKSSIQVLTSELWMSDFLNLERPSEIMMSQWCWWTRLLNDLFKLHTLAGALTLPAFFSSYFFLRGSHVALRPAVTLGTLAFQRREAFLSLSMKTFPHTSGDGEEFVHVWPDSPAFLQPPNRRSKQPDHPNASRFWRTEASFLLQTASTKQLKQDFILWLIQMLREQVQLIFITHAKILIFWVSPKFCDKTHKHNFSWRKPWNL